MIRAMRTADAPVLAQLFLKGRRQAFEWVEPSLFRLEDFAEQTRGERIWVAEKGGSSLRLRLHLGAGRASCTICT